MTKIDKLLSDVHLLDLNKVTEQDIINIICDFGLVYDTGCDYGEWSKFMCSNRADPAIYQTPKQMAGCIMELLRHEINSYLEIGVFSGGSYLLISNILKHKNPNCECKALDITNEYLSEDMKKAIQGLSIGTSASVQGMKFDCVFIDGDHSFRGISTDWENVGQYADIVIIHDINERSCGEVQRWWDDNKVGKNTKEFIYQTDNKHVHGIGMIFNK